MSDKLAKVSTAIESASSFQESVDRIAKGAATEALVPEVMSQSRYPRYRAISFGPAEIPPFSTVDVSTRVFRRFKSAKILNTRNGDLGLRVRDLLVGNRSQFYRQSRQYLPMAIGELVDSLSLASELVIDVCDAEEVITFRVWNASSVSSTFGAIIAGTFL